MVLCMPACSLFVHDTPTTTTATLPTALPTLLRILDIHCLLQLCPDVGCGDPLITDKHFVAQPARLVGYVRFNKLYSYFDIVFETNTLTLCLSAAFTL